MSFQDEMSNLFPRVNGWMGMSCIHVSIYRQSEIELPDSNVGTALKAIQSTHTAELIYQKLNYLFDGVEWLVDEDTFSKLLLVLVKYQLEFKNFETPDMIQNPVTGHFFHRVALLPERNLVLGFRCWSDISGDDTLWFGWRFRVTSLEGDEEQQKVRVEVTRRQKIVLDEVEEVYDMIAEVPEPSVNLEQVSPLYEYNSEVFGDE